MFPGKVTLLTCPTKISYFFQWDMAVYNTLYRIPWKILQILHPSRKRPVRRHSGWRIGLGNPSAGDWNPSAGPVFLRFLGIWFSWRIFSGWNISRCISFSRNADGQGVCGMADFKKLLFFQWKRLVLFFKGLVLFRKEQDVWKVSNVWGDTLLMCGL